MKKDVRAYIAACQVCNQNKQPRTRPAGLLHISLDFITGLPIMVVVDRFSKACKFFAVPGLPSAKEAASLLLQYVVRVHDHFFPFCISPEL